MLVGQAAPQTGLSYVLLLAVLQFCIYAQSYHTHRVNDTMCVEFPLSYGNITVV